MTRAASHIPLNNSSGLESGGFSNSFTTDIKSKNRDGKKKKNLTKKGIEKIIQSVQSKKHSQKALHPQKPSPAVLGSPDDTCHYAEKVTTLRTLTVRELARIQSFPDWFEFRSKVTTGGTCRRYEVPQYTQVGNAVPPLLGHVLGKICKEIIRK